MKQIISNGVAACAVTLTLSIASSFAQSTPQALLPQSDNRPACCTPKPADSGGKRGHFVTQGKATFWVHGSVTAKSQPACCADGNCCVNGTCCSVTGCCMADKSCCDPA